MPRFLRFLLIFFIVWVWVFYNNFQIWPVGGLKNWSLFPTSKIKLAEAVIASNDGLLVYSLTSSSTRFSPYNGSSTNTFTASTSLSVDTATNNTGYVLRTSPTQQEAIVAFASSSSIVVLCYNGTTWTKEWVFTSGTQPTNSRFFDVAYETASGDAMVLYATVSTSTNELAYRTKSGSTSCGSANWSAETALDPVQTSGAVGWVKLAWDRLSSSNLITAIWADYNQDLWSMVWSGTAWGNEPATALETNLE